jgi:hypothetical protein
MSRYLVNIDHAGKQLAIQKPMPTKEYPDSLMFNVTRKEMLWLAVKFTIEIYATADAPIHRAAYFSISPLGARKEAQRLLTEWKRRGATRALVLNAGAETIYKIGE